MVQEAGRTVWQNTETHIHIKGHALNFETISKQEDDVKTSFKSLHGDISMQQAAHNFSLKARGAELWQGVKDQKKGEASLGDCSRPRLRNDVFAAVAVTMRAIATAAECLVNANVARAGLDANCGAAAVDLSGNVVLVKRALNLHFVVRVHIPRAS
jgi:hypothetical protein